LWTLDHSLQGEVRVMKSFFSSPHSDITWSSLFEFDRRHSTHTACVSNCTLQARCTRTQHALNMPETTIDGREDGVFQKRETSEQWCIKKRGERNRLSVTRIETPTMTSTATWSLRASGCTKSGAKNKDTLKPSIFQRRKAEGSSGSVVLNRFLK